MAFTIDASALHRPLGFGLDDARRITVERHAPGRTGAAAAALLPPEGIADGEGQALREELARRGGFLDGVARPVASQGALGPLEPLVVASARGVVDGHGVSVVGFAAGRPLPPRRGALRVLLLTDAALAPPTLQNWLRAVMDGSFASLAGGCVPLPSDAIVALANGVAGAGELEPGSIGLRTLLVGSVAVAQLLVRRLLEESLAPAPARVVQITASGAADEPQAMEVTEALAADVELRAAMAGSGVDRTLCAAVVARVGARTGELRVSWATRPSQAALRIDLGAGAAVATRWTAVAQPLAS